MFFVIVWTLTNHNFNDFALPSRNQNHIFRCHTVTNGTDLRRSPLWKQHVSKGDSPSLAIFLDSQLMIISVINIMVILGINITTTMILVINITTTMILVIKIITTSLSKVAEPNKGMRTPRSNLSKVQKYETFSSEIIIRSSAFNAMNYSVISLIFVRYVVTRCWFPEV